MFGTLTARLEGVFSKLQGKGKLDEKGVREALREIRLALLEADVNYRVVKDFVARIQESAVGEEVLASIMPGQQVVGIVYRELVRLLGDEAEPILWKGPMPLVIMLVGLQGSGKTTTAAKVASLLKARNKKVLLAAADVYRPAAVDQLRILADHLEVGFYQMDDVPPKEICTGAVERATREIVDVVILDTAGRLHINEPMMEELSGIAAGVKPRERLLVLDGMTGQDAVRAAQEFDKRLDLTGIIMTKLDGDARGGAALSVRAVTGKPIKFIGVGEQLEDLESFHPSRIASRILGMGDVVTLVEKAQETVDATKAATLQKKMRKGELTLEDFLDQLKQIKTMGSMDQLLKMIPGASKLGLNASAANDHELVRMEAIISSMTREERQRPYVLNGSRRKRIARGSGTRVQDVNRLLREFEAMRKMMKRFGSGMRGKKMLLGQFH